MINQQICWSVKLFQYFSFPFLHQLFQMFNSFKNLSFGNKNTKNKKRNSIRKIFMFMVKVAAAIVRIKRQSKKICFCGEQIKPAEKLDQE